MLILSAHWKRACGVEHSQATVKLPPLPPVRPSGVSAAGADETSSQLLDDQGGEVNEWLWWLNMAYSSEESN